MYTEYFGLQKAPFNSTLDPSMFYASPQHEEAMASLVYAVQERKGLVVVTGDVGTGKSLLGHMLLTQVSGGATAAVINNSHLLGADLLQAVAREFQLPVEPDFSTMELLSSLEEFFFTQQAKGRHTLIVIDDAHTFAEAHFEQLRLICNLESKDGKLAQIVLLGQFHLQNILQKPRMKQLSQRIFRTFHLSRFNREQTESYIKYRLTTGGLGDQDSVFTDESLDIIYQFSDGTPRLINNLCDNLLLSAFSDNTKVINADRTNMVIDEMMASAEAVGEATLATGQPDDIDKAITQITDQYVQSLENQINELESATINTDQRIQELHRLSAKLRAQELKFSEHQGAIDAKVRDLHRLTVSLQEQEHTLSQRESVLANRLQELRALSERLDGQEKRLAEREARLTEQLLQLDKTSKLIIEQDQKLAERTAFLDNKMTNKQVAFDRELNESRRAINRKWAEMKDMVAQSQERDLLNQNRMTALDRRLQDFTRLEQQIAQKEERLTKFLDDAEQRVSVRIADLNSSIEHLQHTMTTADKLQQKLIHSVKELEQIEQHATTLLQQPRDLLEKTEQQQEQVDRMRKLVQQASESLQQSVSMASEAKKESKAQCQRLDEATGTAEDVIEELSEQTAKTHKLRDVFREIYNHTEKQVSRLETQMQNTDIAVGRFGKMIHELQETAEKPQQLMKELRSMGSLAERNLHDGQVRLGELSSMIARAEKARQSIEALITATRRVAEKTRPMNIARTPLENRDETEITEPAAVERPSTLTQKIETLAEAVRRARSPQTGNAQPFVPPDVNEITMAQNETTQ